MYLNFSVSEENYLKAIYHLQAETGTVSTSALAAKLQTKPASVTDMMKKLNAKKVLHYKPYYGFYLSTEGKRIALIVIRRHRLWEYFLAEKLKFGWDEVHSIAEELEHVSSKKLIDKLDEYLGFPQFDPHGDPIPDSKGKTKAKNKIPLTELPINQVAEVAQVTNQSAEMLELLQHKQISLGTRLEVKKHFPFDQSYEIKVKPAQTVTLSEQLAKNIYVTYVQQGKQ
ncbi:MAG: metal-dependent transcriptional regulator [Bacteroidota bacterium]|nr:metal-dependent transcriptional regulator [Flavisolibacter sp.]MDQ3846365.1 metal-dependent transcriptional regulator [Bacteroidota bacterium]MBD0287036.1 metal-dependent transcriptional regulator [Flavisolibacter sp.]MBD0298166.1 metal-dependent transcriptional regulator [Flavisolibacter sp.]MBD0351888.1 metal-dependent transcriptional regulator [Flavisolibacter sp.]